jgi:pilin isopeptide linkage protein
VRINGAGSAEFGVWSYSKAGTYYYTVSEVNTHASGYIYDTVVYTITDTVTESGGKLMLSRVVSNDSNKPVTTFAFLNKFSEGKEGPPTGDDIDLALYRILLVAGTGVAALAALYHMFVGRRRGIYL